MHMPSNTAAALIQDGVSGEPISSPAHATSSNQNTQVHFALPSAPLNPSSPPSSSSSSPPTTAEDLNAAVTTSLPPSAPSSLPSTPAASEMFLFDYSSEHLEIVLASDNIVLRGVGQDVEPTVFAGQVVLRLSEATNIKEINLNFAGKSRLPNADSRAPAFRQPFTTTTFFSHDWSLLEGSKGLKHTLKAGTHTFPFQLNIDDTFPSTISVGNSSSISYKLRATVVRSSFSANWATQRPVTVVRGFSPEALEYNQTLEIENTWPGKIMYSVMIPHKAFAAGDEVPVSLKFTPLVKGVSVISIETAIKQYLAVRSRSAGSFQDGRVVAKVTHFIRNGLPVEARAGRRTSPTLWDVSSAYVRTAAVMTPGEQAEPDRPPLPDTPGSGPSSGRGSSENEHAVEDDLERGDNELDTCIKFRIPAWTIPSNMSEPIIVNYKLKWSITLSNLDGHTSELRCALPLHVLSNVLLDEARAASRQTRAVLFGADNDNNGEGGEEGEHSRTILPSYASHVQDRIANALDAVAPTRLAPNPLHHLGGAGGSAGPSTPEESPELVDTGLLLSLGESASTYFRNAAAAGGSASTSTNSNSDSRRSSFRTGGRGGSSRTSSRATSPEPPELGESTANTTPSSSLGSSGGSKSFFSLKPLTNLANKISNNSRSMSQIAHPATGSAVGMNAQHSNPASPKILGRGLRLSRPPSSSNLRAELTNNTAPQTQMEMLSDLLSRVPNYERASQGFLGGGVLPLETYAGLPTYNEVEEDVVGGNVGRVQSDGALLQNGGAGGAAGYVHGGGDDVDALRRDNATPRPRMSVTGLERRRQASFTLDP